MNDAAEPGFEDVVKALVDEAMAFRTDFQYLDAATYFGSEETGADGKSLLPYYAAIAVLAREMHQYLDRNPRPDSVFFDEVVRSVHDADFVRWGAQAFPTYQNLLPDDLTFGVADLAAAGTPTLTLLDHPALVREWTTRPGLAVFHAYLKRLDDRLTPLICGDDGLYAKYAGRKVTAPEVHVLIVTAILTDTATPSAFWAPLGALMSVSLMRRGLKRYCQGRSTPGDES